MFQVFLGNSSLGSLNIEYKNSGKSLMFKYPCSNVENCTYYGLNIATGVYKIECWGASGGDYSTLGGKGGYVSGIITLNEYQTIYLYIGSKGISSRNRAFNGGGMGNIYGGSGGGSTDIRMVNTSDFEGMKSRIMVAGGGGGGSAHEGSGKNAGGGLIGLMGYEAINTGCFQAYPNITVATGGTQVSGGLGGIGNINGNGKNGSFGYGGDVSLQREYGAGGGGGYYGGGAGPTETCRVGGGGGGSSYVSGYSGCNSIKYSSTESNIEHSNTPIHYSGYFFIDPSIKDGLSSFPSPFNIGQEIGHVGDGAIMITSIDIHSIPCTLILQGSSSLSSLVLVLFYTLYLVSKY